ncbi:MAG: hypothetical protein CSB44_07835 [Gammaproteobacteria bacterium]|nr:MAG: hypothetical protein CSB44_07835 [Gammaproteobacteria bacterium]
MSSVTTPAAMAVRYVVPVMALLLGACSGLSNPYGPDRVYSDKSEEAVALQVPPGLTDISDAEQFVLPGNRRGAVSRNTLLPGFDSVRFERDGGQAWLVLNQPPETVWPLLLAYLRREGIAVASTEPVNGLITSQWQEFDGEGGLRALVGGETRQRLAFRLERDGDDGSRLFTRVQVASAEQARTIGDTPKWPRAAHAPENTSTLLADLLVFFGASEQEASGILSSSAAEALFEDAEVLSTNAGSELLIHRGFVPAYRDSRAALVALGYEIVSEDDGIGRIRFNDGERDVILALAAEHVSAVRARVLDAEGEPMPAARRDELLDELQAQLA